MLSILGVTFPFFALVLAGFVAAKRGWLPLDAIPGLNGFVLYFALPCMLFRFGANTPMAQLLDGSVALLYTLSATGMVLLGMWTLKKHHNWNESAFGTMAVAFPNTGYMGLPLLLSLFGAAAVGPAIVTIVVDLFFTSSVCIALSRLDQAQTHGARTALLQAIKSVFSIPLIWAIGLGALVSINAWVVPEMLTQTVGLMAGAAAPVALFTIGTLLARPVPSDSRGWWHWQHGGVDALLVFLKLVVHPVLVCVLGWVLMQLGLPLTPTALMAVVLVAALPSASNSALLAERFGADSARITRVILLSTALAFPSFSAWVAWYKA
ncbi:MAG: AEC family transporter [Betaproteobacteria bacterium]|nr:AEC family transporter [Betaproteobacteria bacterium]NDF05866.1 AEC family transporter [Betaproteobacteria bacterium]